jgi:alpha-galactosidase
MKTPIPFLRRFNTALAGLVLTAANLASHAAVVPVTGVTGHDGGNWPATLGHLSDMVNALNPGWATGDHNTGMDTSANLSDPATWIYSGSNWQQEWKANSRLNPLTSSNAKIGWSVLDLGSSTPALQNLYLWNVRSQNTTENVATYNLYYADSPTATLPAMPNSKSITGDYNFSSGGWTLLNTGGALSLPVNGSNNNTPQAIVALGGISARYIGIEILTAGGTATRVGLAQVEITRTVADNEPPTLASSDIVDDQGGASVDVNSRVTYTVTFNEDMNGSTVTAADFDNAGTSAITLGAITETAPGVFTVEVLPTTVGTLRLRVPISAYMTDASGNPLDNDPAIADDTTLTVTADTTPPTLASTDIVDDQGGGPVDTNTVVIYAVTFSEDMNAGTVGAADFSNAGTSDITIGPIAETSPGVFTVEVTPTTEGTLRLQIPVSASMTDLAGIPLDNNPAIIDDTTITVQAGSGSALVEISSLSGSHGGDQYANGTVSLTNGSGITKADPDDPSTWTFSNANYWDEWMASYLKSGGVVTPGLNGKVAWCSLDFGSKTALGTLYLFNTNYSSGVSGTDQFNLYYADSPAVALPAQPTKGTYAITGLTPQGDYNFAGGGWTLFNTTGPLNASQAAVTAINLPNVAARYLAIEILSNQGDASGGGRAGFDEIAVTAAPPDSDGDGMSDDFELAHTAPPSATALIPGADLENGGAGDGLSNLQEYQLGTNPTDPDSDDDNLQDGPEVAGAGSRPPTDPLDPDSDDDGLDDDVETHTGTWAGAADTGTDPTNSDTDSDGLADSVETNTGTYLSTTDTGTNPLNPNSDGDLATDWYEVAIIDKNPSLGNPPNSPNDANLKPNIPYPLPDPNPLDTGVANQPVKVYIMSGQSNMVGFGQVAGTKPGTLQTITGAENKFPNLVASGGGWTTRNDVKYRGVVSDIGNGQLRPDVAGGDFGPELGFGYVMGWHHDAPVLLIKASIGNRSLMWDFAPPTTPSFDWTDDYTYAGYGQSPNRWLTATGAPSPFVWYAGKQFDDCFKKEADMAFLTWQDATAYQASGNIGTQVRHNGVEYQCKLSHTSSPASEPGVGAEWTTYWSVFSITNTADILDNFSTEYTSWAAQGFEIAGFVWWQGYNDRGEPAATLYRENMARFIGQIRAYYENRYPNKGAANAPFVLATLAADGGWNNTQTVDMKVAQAQLDVAGDVSNVKTMEARGFWRDSSESPSAVGYHYNWNAETYMLVGDALGRAMVELQGNVTPPGDGYAGWIDGPFAADLTDYDASLDFDRGGLETGIEWVVGGDPTTSSDDAGLAPTLDTTSNPDGKVRFVFRRSTEAAADANTSITVQYGNNLSGWTNAVHQGTGANQITITEVPNGSGPGIDQVTVALPASLAGGGKLFARLSVVVTTP